MTGRHSAEGSASELRMRIGEIVFDVNQQISALTTIKQDSRTIASKILMLHTRDVGVMIAGGALMNNLPNEIDHIVKGLQIHMNSLETYLEGL